MNTVQLNANQISRRRHARYTFMRPADWDFFTEGSGTKTGFIENISEAGILLCSAEMIEHRRWIRLVVREPHRNLWFTMVGRVIRRENRMESWQDEEITLYRYGIELIHPLNPMVLERIQEQLEEIPVAHETQLRVAADSENNTVA